MKSIKKVRRSPRIAALNKLKQSLSSSLVLQDKNSNQIKYGNDTNSNCNDTIVDNPFLLIQLLGIDLYPSIVSNITDVYTFKNFCLTITAKEKIKADVIVNYFFKSKIIYNCSRIQTKWLYDKYVLYTAYLLYTDFEKSALIDKVYNTNCEYATIVCPVRYQKCIKCSLMKDIYIILNQKKIIFYSVHGFYHISFLVLKFDTEGHNFSAASDLRKLLYCCQDIHLTNVYLIDIVPIYSDLFIFIIKDNDNIIFYNIAIDNDNFIVKYRRDIVVSAIFNVSDIIGISYTADKISFYINETIDSFNKIVKFDYFILPITRYNYQYQFISVYIYSVLIDGLSNNNKPMIEYTNPSQPLNYYLFNEYNSTIWDYLIRLSSKKTRFSHANSTPNIYLLGVMNNNAYYVMLNKRYNNNMICVTVDLNCLYYEQIDRLLRRTVLSFKDLYLTQ
ncbi:MAG: hypothetical protein [Cotesia congregata filamentous virus 2]